MTVTRLSSSFRAFTGGSTARGYVAMLRVSFVVETVWCTAGALVNIQSNQVYHWAFAGQQRPHLNRNAWAAVSVSDSLSPAPAPTRTAVKRTTPGSLGSLLCRPGDPDGDAPTPSWPRAFAFGAPRSGRGDVGTPPTRHGRWPHAKPHALRPTGSRSHVRAHCTWRPPPDRALPLAPRRAGAREGPLSAARTPCPSHRASYSFSYVVV
mmetsp:Transcript_29010/g.78027  ORF Transcript_29010/g.78027 Transcript_29010/m.78027 type:complete len:208 (-) Transcript_29010:193-816(-)